MKFKLDRKQVLDNIEYLIKQKDIKIGELEEKADVSPGLISRMAKEGSTTKISLEFLVSVASVLDISVDSLVNYNYRGLNSTDLYLVEFLKKLIQQTTDGKLFWNKETERDLGNIYFYSDDATSHPLFTVGVDTYGQRVPEYVSKFSQDGRAKVAGSIYNVCIGGNKYMFIAPVKYKWESSVIDYEVYFTDFNKRSETWYNIEGICASDINKQCVFNNILSQLYTALLQSDTHAKVSSNALAAIDLFMNKDKPAIEYVELSDDGELPF